ncbi:hypothetical protein H6F75_27485 [Nodosilinea sp. FACHB-131]|uniref:hypothetical protein n=2 Tax=Cyanophyceae TaxID=3028117 RepID=UPI001689424A|nr:hypothetical protein [Nodosilinea sp. FACHB-131]MBD1877230.1 hypothetical protein [Nodosilinea sp. FACHB-131]
MLALFNHRVTDSHIREVQNGEIKFEGETNYSPCIDLTSIKDLLDKRTFACIAFAGSSAEDKFIGCKDDCGMSIFDGGLDDWIQYQTLRLKKGSHKPLLELTNKIIDEHWPLVSELAEALYQSGSLNSQEIEAILNAKISTCPASKYLQIKRSQYEHHLRNIKLELFKKSD